MIAVEAEGTGETAPSTPERVIAARAINPVVNASKAFAEAARSLTGVEYEVTEDGTLLEAGGQRAFGLDVFIRDDTTVALELHAHSESSQRLAVEMFCGDASPEEVVDALGEVLNITAGLVKRRLYEDGHVVKISLPKIRAIHAEEAAPEHDFGADLLRGEIDLALTQKSPRPK